MLALSRQLAEADVGGVKVQDEEELQARENAARPALRARIAAGRTGQPLHAAGRDRAARNLAQHAGLGAGRASLEEAARPLNRFRWKKHLKTTKSQIQLNRKAKNI